MPTTSCTAMLPPFKLVINCTVIHITMQHE